MKRAAAFSLVALALAACRTAAPVPDREAARAPAGKGVYHVVEAGQTLWRIARAYGVSVQRLAEVNDLRDQTAIVVGEKLWIPGAARVLHVEPAPALRPRASAKVLPAEPKVETHRQRFLWPVKGILTSRFGVRDGEEHDGIDIAAPKGTPIHAAGAGKVLFSGTERGYGELVLVQHADGLITIYAHCSRRDVKAGETVTAGEVIGLVGQTGRATGPHLHFEVREQREPRNPLFFLP